MPARHILLRPYLDADADYDRLEKEAASILAVKKAEAEGIYALKKALEGAGGRNLVKMEYARRLRNAKVIGTPVLKASEEIPQLRIRERQLQKTGETSQPACGGNRGAFSWRRTCSALGSWRIVRA